MRQGTPKLGSVERSLDLFEGIILDQGRKPANEIGQQLGLKRATVFRIVKTLEAHGQLRTSQRGHYVAGPRTLQMLALIDRNRVQAELARQLIRKLAKMVGHTVHLGVLEGDMTTYLVKESGVDEALFTRENMQLESYCSVIGKVLLAHLPEADQERYLANGSFVRLTRHTIVDPGQLREHLKKVRAAGYAIDDREIAPDLYCLAVPIVQPDRSVTLALSVSSIDQGKFEKSFDALLKKLTQTAEQIARRLRD